MGLSWMAWTWPTAFFFTFIVCCLVTMTVLEFRNPGGAPKRGVFGIDTTRGDRLFISLLGSAFIHLAWLGLADGPLYIATAIAALWWGFVFRWV